MTDEWERVVWVLIAWVFGIGTGWSFNNIRRVYVRRKRVRLADEEWRRRRSTSRQPGEP